MYLLGYDIGSSFIKASLLDAQTGKLLAAASAPDTEMTMISHQPGWAEQNPEVWWQNAKSATTALRNKGFDLKQVKAIGISYQMHGLVIVDKNKQVLRPSIIWCDSRAVTIGDKAFAAIGEEKSLVHLLNSPGNFTASKLKWVKENEPELYSRIDKMMLPGDYLAMCLTGEVCSTASGLSEGILWDYQTESPASLLLEYYGISPDLLPVIKPTFAVQGEVTQTVANELGLTAGTPVAYRAGDQPNNAFSLNVLEPGELAATAGTSGVVYGITDQKNYDIKSRVNTFLHVNHRVDQPRYGTLLCVNGTGILNRWLKNMVMGEKVNGSAYVEMNKLASQAPIGSQGLVTIPYGNGAERSLENKLLGSSVHGLDFNMHNKAHLLRSAQEGIVFALNLGVDVMRGLGIEPKTVRAGDANMFLSPLFSEAFAAVTGAVIELYNTDGAQGAARGAGVGAGIYKNMSEAFRGLHTVRTIEPDPQIQAAYREAYQHWLNYLKKELV
jgi:xylulokinase